MNVQNAISLNDVRKIAPSVFATKPHSKMSDRYAFIPTTKIIEQLVKDHNFEVVAAVQRSTRNGGRNPMYTRHMITLRPKGVKAILGEVIPQLLLVNSHDGQCRYILRGGLFRLICLNGLVTSIADAVCCKIHIGDPKPIIDASLEIVSRVAEVKPMLEAMMKKKLTDAQQASFAVKAAKIAYDEPLSFDPKLLLKVNRPEDEGNDVWHVFNRLQENIMRGGVEFVSQASKRTFRTRGLTHIGRTIDMNTSLWSVAEKLAA